MKTRTKELLVSAALVMAPIAAHAEAGQVYLTPYIGVESFDKDRNINQATTYGIGGEYLFTDHLAAELGYSFSSKATTHRGDQGVSVDRVYLDGLYYFGRMGYQQMYNPYIKLGVSHFNYDYHHGISDDQGTQAEGGLGLRLHFTDRWSARAEALALHDTNESQTHALYTLGVSYAFGGQTKPAEAPPPAPVVAAPPPAPVDSDGDGVYDDRDQCPNTPRGREVDENGCEYVLKKREEIRLEIKFATDKSEVTEAYMGEVEKVAKFLHKYGNVKAVIEGHTDSTGSHAHNLKLSEARADAVRSLLVSRFHIDPSRLSAVGYAETRPIDSNKTAAGRAQNRRVVAVMDAEVDVPVYKK
jgi:OOP family OmpA-OmpF porin